MINIDNIIDKLTTDYYKVLDILYDNQVTVDNETFCPITQADVSKKLGLSIMTINSLFKELKNDGLVIQDEKKLRKYYLTYDALEIIKKMKKL